MGASARLIQEALGGKKRFGFEKKMFSQKYCIRSVSAPLVWRSLKKITEMCVLGGLQKWIRLRRKAPICYIYTAFVKMSFSNSKTEVPAQIPTKRNNKVRGSKKQYKNSAFSNYVFGNSNLGGASTRVFSTKLLILVCFLDKALDSCVFSRQSYR